MGILLLILWVLCGDYFFYFYILYWHLLFYLIFPSMILGYPDLIYLICLTAYKLLVGYLMAAFDYFFRNWVFLNCTFFLPMIIF